MAHANKSSVTLRLKDGQRGHPRQFHDLGGGTDTGPVYRELLQPNDHRQGGGDLAAVQGVPALWGVTS